MQETNVIPGKVLYCDSSKIYCARGLTILQSSDGGQSWKFWVKLPGRIGDIAAVLLPLVERLLRKGIHHLAFSKDSAIVIANRESFCITGGAVKSLGRLTGSRTMALCQADGKFYYGEYRRNSERSPVHVWKWQKGDLNWLPVWRFEGIRHVHGVFHDPYTDAIWVTTGDTDVEAGIWRTNDGFSTLHQVAGGSQQLRAVYLLFTEAHLYFGSDAPDEQNHLYRMNREGGNIERLQAAVGGPIFYGCKVANSLFFSTVVEPGSVNTSRLAEVWRTDNGSDWEKILEFEKDIWSMKYFQYGQVLFPTCPGDGKHLYCMPLATKGHGKTCVLDIQEKGGLPK